MLETYNLIKEAMISEDIVHDDYNIDIIKKQFIKFIKQSKFAETLLVPCMGNANGVKEVDADEYLERTKNTFPICIQILPDNTFMSEEAWNEILTWLENGAIGKIFTMNNKEFRIVKIDLYNDVFLKITLEHFKRDEESDSDSEAS